MQIYPPPALEIPSSKNELRTSGNSCTKQPNWGGTALPP